MLIVFNSNSGAILKMTKKKETINSYLEISLPFTEIFTKPHYFQGKELFVCILWNLRLKTGTSRGLL